jgi:hypothetical protein
MPRSSPCCWIRQLLVGQAREAFQAQLTARSHRPTAMVRVAQLGQDAGLIGAADLARMQPFLTPENLPAACKRPRRRQPQLREATI